jgi:hypothetical protein
MNSSDLPTQVSERHWLVSELGNELETLATTPYPLVHRFLMHSLTRKMAQVTESACSSLPEPVTTPVACSPTLQGAHQSKHVSSQKGQEIL